MEKKQKQLKTISVINSILLILAMLVCMLIIMTNTSPYYIISSLAEFLALLFSLFYFFNLYKKDAAKFYSIFMVLYAFTYLAETIAYLIDHDSIGLETAMPGIVLAGMILYGNTLILAVGKDLGKKISYILCGINVVFYLLPILGVIIPGVVTFADGAMKSNVLLYCVWFIMALNAFVMTVAKYTDKAMRGSK